MTIRPRLLVTLTLLSLIITVGLKYRFRSYDSFPPVSENFDEQVLVWGGSSLINNGVPTAWSFIDDYVKKPEAHLIGWGLSLDDRKPNLSNFSTFQKPMFHRVQMTLDGYETQFNLVQPHIEQPPLGPVLASFLSGSYQKSGLDQVTLKQMRLPVIWLSGVSMVLIFLIGYLTAGPATALLAGLIFALTPTMVISSRIATAESYLTPFMLLGVLFTQLWVLKDKKAFLIAASVLITICYLIKPFGISLAGVIFLAFLVFRKPVKQLIYPIICLVLGAVIFLAYGYYYAPVFFPKILTYQSNRLYSPLEGVFKIILPKIIKVFLDGWIVFGWISAGALFIQNELKKNFWILAPLFSHLLVLALYGGEDYGWYRIPLYPFLALAAATIIVRGVKNAQLPVGIIFLVTAFITSLWWATPGFAWNSVAFPFRVLIGLVIVLLSIGLTNSRKAKLVSSATLIVVVAATFWLSIQTINNTQLIWPTLREATIVWPLTIK